MSLARPFSELRGDSSFTLPRPTDPPRRSRFGRARTAMTSIPSFFTRSRQAGHRAGSSQHNDIQQLTSSHDSHEAGFLPDIDVPDLDLNFEPIMSPPTESLPRNILRRDSPRPSSLFSDRLTALRHDRGLRSVTNSLRRRRSPLRRGGEDQAAMLSRLLSVAAAATAASLMRGNPRAVSEARSTGLDGEDGTFDGFLQALQNGRIASALRQGSGNESEDSPEGANGGSPAPLNFFRMFRFESSSHHTTTAGSRGDNMSTARGDNSANHPTNEETNNDGTDARLIPIIIVGIRSITPGNGNGQDDGQMIPPFIDALSNFPTTFPTGTPGGASIDNILRPPQNGTRFSHRRRASMGGLNNFPSGYDSQRHHRSPERTRPWSTISETSTGPRPPPTTPASPGLSAVSSGATTPVQPTPANTSASSTAPHSRAPSRRESLISRLPPSSANLASTAEESPLLPPSTQPSTSNPSGSTSRFSPRQRRLSESDFPTRFGSGSSRRNGVVEPLEAARPPSSAFSHAPSADASPPASTSSPNANPGSSPNTNAEGNESGSRSWIIYVLGGSYPENHPILTTPSLFTENPTYEDMLLLSALLGPAKPPVASATDVESAGGLYRIEVRTPTMEPARQPSHESSMRSINRGEQDKQAQREIEQQLGEEGHDAALLVKFAQKTAPVASVTTAGDVSMIDVLPDDSFRGRDEAIKVSATTGVKLGGKVSRDGQADSKTKAATLVAVALEGSDTILLTSEQRCLVCLCDFEEKEITRKLVKCGHLYHQECIDQWLTTGRNSCPLCRGQGVDEMETSDSPGTLARSTENTENSNETHQDRRGSRSGEIDVDMRDVVE
ncbi:MAG: hypothetical protein M1820_002835 [Bogoriella megaspora]|nr:MAG: hypothetical protein M1820_002835 [Bogoriella megaspora]